MAAYTNRIKPVQPRFLAAFAPAIAQDFVTANNEGVGNELLVAPVLFGFAAVDVGDVGLGRDDGEIFLHFEAHALEYAELFKKFPLETKDPFFSSHNRPNVDEPARGNESKLLFLFRRYSQPGINHQDTKARSSSWNLELL